MNAILVEDDRTDVLTPGPPAEPANPPPPEADPFQDGVVICDRYRIENMLGCGGSSIVYRARDLHWEAAHGGGPFVAIKSLLPQLRQQPASIAGLKREFYRTRMLAHPCIVRMYDIDCHRGAWFIVMELLTGRSLGAQLRSGDALPAGRVEDIVAACRSAMQWAHLSGVVHGDLSPSNIYVLDSGAIRILDFGASSSEGGIPPAATRSYASPRVVTGGAPTPADDSFSLARIEERLQPAPEVAAPPARGRRWHEHWRGNAAAALALVMFVAGGLLSGSDRQVAPAENAAPPVSTAIGRIAELPVPTIPLRPAAVADARPATPAPLQAVSFASPAMSVSSRASAAALSLQRKNGRNGSMQVNWRLDPGTAIAGQDFGGPPSGVAVLADLQTVTTVFIPLPAPAARGLPRHFSVVLTQISGNAQVGENDRVTVTIR